MPQIAKQDATNDKIKANRREEILLFTEKQNNAE